MIKFYRRFFKVKENISDSVVTARIITWLVLVGVLLYLVFVLVLKLINHYEK
ncbi:MAG: hypothetical protein NTX03_05100 [Bacteroidetes bacterium]|nr:hypothetical protein [Bacteroidota bacterium]